MTRKAILIALLACLLLTLTVRGLASSSLDTWRTLRSLRRVDDHPLYVMRYYGDYDLPVSVRPSVELAERLRPTDSATEPAWACTCFAALGDPQAGVFGRNFDWHDHPALLLFAAPPGRYASVSMVDISYLGMGEQTPSWTERRRLLAAPQLPFDGMNERGLVVGMMAVPQAESPQGSKRETVDSLLVIRLLLDYAQNVEEALAIFEQFGLDWGGGPPLHYLVADADGHSAVVEFVKGELRVLRNSQPWQVATNFVLSEAEAQGTDTQCWRYNRARQVLQESGGLLSAGEAMTLLQSVSQENTIWSMVYGMGDDRVQVVMDRAYGQVHSFPFEVRR